MKFAKQNMNAQPASGSFVSDEELDKVYGGTDPNMPQNNVVEHLVNHADLLLTRPEISAQDKQILQNALNQLTLWKNSMPGDIYNIENIINKLEKNYMLTHDMDING